MSDLVLAMSVAKKFHKGQMYSGEQPYTVHLAAVEKVVQDFFPADERLREIAWLHDIIEDTMISKQALLVLFDSDVVYAVEALTKIPGESRESYLSRVKANPLARPVKIADSYSNMTESLKRGDMKRVKKYGEYIAYLAA